MATLAKAVQLSKAVNNVSKLFTNLTLSSNVVCTSVAAPRLRLTPYQCAYVHTTPRLNDLMEFFDSKKNWGEYEVKTGRSWKKDELRIKSNEDLHKLWYVLLKERNMLMTMEHACIEEYELFPNPERKDKVNESMENLEAVVRERNQSYHLLETGESGERPGRMVWNPLGLRVYYRMTQHKIPKILNSRWRNKYKFGFAGHAVGKFRRYYKEKIWDGRRKSITRDRNHVMHLFKRFPNMDIEALKKQYPNVNIKVARDHKKARGHFVPE